MLAHCADCKKFRVIGSCPRCEWKSSAKNRWGFKLNHIACMPSDKACKEFEPDKKRIRYNKRVFRKAMEALI